MERGAGNRSASGVGGIGQDTYSAPPAVKPAGGPFAGARCWEAAPSGTSLLLSALQLHVCTGGCCSITVLRMASNWHWVSTRGLRPGPELGTRNSGVVPHFPAGPPSPALSYLLEHQANGYWETTLVSYRPKLFPCLFLRTPRNSS